METFYLLSFSLCYLLITHGKCFYKKNQPRIDKVATMKSNQLVSISRNFYFYIVLTLFLL